MHRTVVRLTTWSCGRIGSGEKEVKKMDVFVCVLGSLLGAVICAGIVILVVLLLIRLDNTPQGEWEKKLEEWGEKPFFSKKKD